MRLFKKLISLIAASVFLFSQVVFGSNAGLPLPTELPIEDSCHTSTVGEVINGMWQEKQDIEQRNMIEKERRSFSGYINMEPNEEDNQQNSLDADLVSLLIEDIFGIIDEINKNHNEAGDNFDIIGTSYNDKGRLISYTKITEDQTIEITNIIYDQQDRVVSYTENSKFETQNHVIERQNEASLIYYNDGSSDFSLAKVNLSLERTDKNDNSKEKINISGKMRHDDKGKYYLAHGTSIRFYFWSEDNLSINIKQEHITKDETSLKTLQELHAAFASLIIATNKVKEGFISQLDFFCKEENVVEAIKSRQKDNSGIIRNTIDIDMEADVSITDSNNKLKNLYAEKDNNQGYQVSRKADKIKEAKCSILKILMESQRIYDNQLKSANSNFLSRISEVNTFIKEPILAVSAEGIKALIYIPPKSKK